MEAVAMPTGLAIGLLTLFLIFVLIAAVLCCKALRQGVAFEAELKARSFVLAFRTGSAVTGRERLEPQLPRTDDLDQPQLTARQRQTDAKTASVQRPKGR